MTNFYTQPLRPEDILHYGMPRRSGRYPWGSGDRPYQSGGGPMKKPSLLERLRDRKKKEPSTLQGETSSKERQDEEFEKEKERIVKSGSATEVLSLQGRISNQELQQAVTRLNLESQLKNLSAKEMKSAIDDIDKLMKGVKMGIEWVKIGTDTYNSLVAIYNTTKNGKDKPLPLIGQGGGGKKKDKNKDKD